MRSQLQHITQKGFIKRVRLEIIGLFTAIISKMKLLCLPIVYQNRLLMRWFHPKLQTVYLELTNKCNLHCKMCKWQSREKSGFISAALFRHCIDQFAELKVDALNMQFGGESLLHPNFKDFLIYAISKRDAGKIGSVGLTDNGMLFTRSVADFFVSLKVDWVNFSLDGLGEVNDNIRVGSKYSVIKENIDYLLEKRGSANKPVILLNIVDYGKTPEQKTAFFDEWVMKVDGIELLPSILPNNSWQNKDDLLLEHKTAPPPKFCASPFNTIIVSWDGKVTGCCFDSNVEMILGDAEEESIKDIWNGYRFQALRRSVITNIFPNGSPCKNCEFWKVNFEPGFEHILNGKARIEYSGAIRKIRKECKMPKESS